MAGLANAGACCAHAGWWYIARDCAASGATNAFMEFMKLPTAHEAMMAQGCFLAPHAGVNTATYADGTLRGQGDIFQL